MKNKWGSAADGGLLSESASAKEKAGVESLIDHIIDYMPPETRRELSRIDAAVMELLKEGDVP